MTIPTEPYLEQQSRWPSSGRHILAHFDEKTIVVYQASIDERFRRIGSVRQTIR